MKIDIFAKNIEPNDALGVFIEDKIGSLARYLKNRSPLEARVEIGLPSKHHRSGNIFYAEVNLVAGGELLRATARHDDLRSAVIEIKDELQVQIKRLKEKKKDLARRSKHI